MSACLYVRTYSVIIYTPAIISILCIYTVFIGLAWCVCVCVRVNCYNKRYYHVTSIFHEWAGGMRPSCKRMPTKLCMMVEARADHPGVPATYLFLRWDEAKPKNLHADFLVLYFDTSCWTTCTVFAIWFQGLTIRIERSERLDGRYLELHLGTWV